MHEIPPTEESQSSINSCHVCHIFSVASYSPVPSLHRDNVRASTTYTQLPYDLRCALLALTLHFHSLVFLLGASLQKPLKGLCWSTEDFCARCPVLAMKKMKNMDFQNVIGIKWICKVILCSSILEINHAAYIKGY